MMPSLDHCMNKPTEMTTISNSLEVFDTYKHREEKDSDEESFHLPLDDDETDTKFQDGGGKNETEDEILNKFESTPAPVEHIDDQHLEDRLLEDEVEGKTSKVENETNKNGENSQNESRADEDKPADEQTKEIERMDVDVGKVSEEDNKETNICEEVEGRQSEITEDTDVPNVVVDPVVDPIVDQVVDPVVDPDLSHSIKDSNAVDILNHNNDTVSEEKIENNVTNLENAQDAQKKEEPVGDTTDHKEELKCTEDKLTEKSESSNDSVKQHNEDSEDLFDISIIRDAAEDNAESAYNETHPDENHVEESEDYDDSNEDKLEEELSSKREDEEDDENDDHEDQLKNDDVDIEESNLKLDCDKEVSDKDSDDASKSKDKTENVAEVVSNSVTDEKLDEVTGHLVASDSTLSDSSDKPKSVADETTAMEEDDSQKRKSLKRGISEEDDENAAKKCRTEETTDVEIKEVDKPKPKLPLTSLLSLSSFMKAKKNNKRLTLHDLEEFCLQKICEVVVHKSDLGDVHHQLKIQEQLIETMRKEIQQLTKQARDLEIVNKKLMNDLKQQTTTQKPLNPLKITRSVGLQVKFTPAFDSNVKRRQPNSTATGQKGSAQTTTNRSRNIPNSTGPSTVNRQTSSQKTPQQPLSKPTTPLLSQALNRRTSTSGEVANKTPVQNVRPKPIETKSGTPSASVIDLTDEDDKNKNSSSKMVSQKNIAVPLRPAPVRVNTTASIRLSSANLQGKVTPITSVVTSSAPQVMYLVQSSPQNVTSSLGTKAVVVNFQSTNGVLTSALNGSAVSVIPKQPNTIQLKSVTPTKAMPNKIVKTGNKHPAPLPPPPVVRVSSDKPLKPIPPKPHLTIRKTDTGIILQWKMPYELDMYEVIASYQLYAYQETSAMPSTDMWRKVGDVKALALPMACTLTQFADKNKYYFAVRPVDIHKRIGVFSEPEEISL